MSKVSNSYLNVLIKLLVLLALAKAIALVVWWFLPEEGIEIKENQNFNPPYQRVDFRNMLSSGLSVNAAQKSDVPKKESVGITSMILKGLYGNKNKGFIIVALKSNAKKTSIVAVGENYSGYKLKSILSNGALFTKGGKEFILRIKSVKTNLHASVTRAQAEAPMHTVSRQDIKFYEKHPEEIWKDISIMERKQGKRINGFQVTRVRKNSKMDRLGLKRGDVIIRANNVELNSYKSVFDLYKNINKIDTLQLVVLRNNEEKELVYEIH